MNSVKTFDINTVKTVGIIGPITTSSYFGGVATFDENLAIAFQKMGYNTFLLSNQPDLQQKNFHGVPIKKINLFNSASMEFDLVVCSLTSIKFLKNINARYKIAFLHGFFTIKYYGLWKAMAAIEYQKFFIKYADAVIANSRFTQFMNNESAGIRTDGVVRLGVSYDFLNELKKAKSKKRESKSILYTGRLVSVKRVDNILKAIKLLKDEGFNYHLYVVGDGPEKENLVDYSKQYDLNVTFVGKVDQKQIVRYYQKSEIFISLNESEPFGITFCEALVAGCRIVCPFTGGQVEFLRDYPNMARIIEQQSPIDIANAIKTLSSNEARDIVNPENFTYEQTAKSILKIASNKGN